MIREREGMLAMPWPGKRAPTEGDASIPSPRLTAPAPTRFETCESAMQGNS
jgi:hypothetical protein